MNPFDNQPAYGKMIVGKVPLPGIITEITGADRKWKFDVQKPVNAGGASVNFKGEEVAESIKVKCSLTTAAHFVDLATCRKALVPPRGTKPTAFDVVNAILNNNDIKSVELKMFGQETYAGGGLWTVELEFIEFNPPKPTTTGAANGSTAASPKFVELPSANSEADRALDGLLKKAAAA